MLGLTLHGVAQQVGGDRECRHGSGGDEASIDGNVVAMPWSRDRGGATEQQLESLVRTIESEIIPRLMLAHRGVVEVLPRLGVNVPSIVAADVTEFMRLVLTTDISIVIAAVDLYRTRGIRAETICLDLLAPAARKLGELWEADLCDFVEVTLALGRLQQVLRDISPVLRDEVEIQSSGNRIVLAPAPGDQHSLGLMMVREFFRSAGWDVSGGSTIREAEVQELIRNEWFDAAGLSMGSENQLEALKRFIRTIRATSKNPNIGIMVGGPIFSIHPEYVAMVGADATASDAPQAVIQAETLVALRR